MHRYVIFFKQNDDKYKIKTKIQNTLQKNCQSTWMTLLLVREIRFNKVLLYFLYISCAILGKLVAWGLN